MTGKKMATVIVLFVFCSVQALPAFGAQSKKELIDELQSVRAQKTALMDGYDEDIRKANREAEEKIGELKVNFRKSREVVLAEKEARHKQLTADYNAAIKPVLKSEKDLIPLVGRDAMEDFVKTKK